MNAAERLWQALAARDWVAVAAQFLPHAVVEWPHSGERLSTDELLFALRVKLADQAVTLRRVVAPGGGAIAVEATVGATRCAGFYDVHEGRIAHATEYWVTPPGGA